MSPRQCGPGFAGLAKVVAKGSRLNICQARLDFLVWRRLNCRHRTPATRPAPKTRKPGEPGRGKAAVGGESPGRAYTFLHSLLNCGRLLTRFRNAFHWPHWLYCPHWLDWPHWPHWPQRLHWLAPLATLAGLATLAILTKKPARPPPCVKRKSRSPPHPRKGVRDVY